MAADPQHNSLNGVTLQDQEVRLESDPHWCQPRVGSLSFINVSEQRYEKNPKGQHFTKRNVHSHHLLSEDASTQGVLYIHHYIIKTRTNVMILA
ncbi:hypothetical protein D3C74_17130 [compost metagenome]